MTYTPNSFTSNCYLRVNSAGNAIEYVSDAEPNNFIELGGTPSSYTANCFLKVNSGGTGLEYTSAAGSLGAGTHITIDGNNDINHDSPGTGVNWAGCASNSNWRIHYVQWDNLGHVVSASAVNLTSDYRAKTCIQPYENAYDMVKLVDTYKYVFKEDENKEEHVGMMAHELQEAGATYGVTGYKDQVDENGEPIYQSVNLERLVPTLWSALKTAINKIEDLETRLATLELQLNT